MEDVMVISITHHLSLLCPSGAPRVPTPDPSFLVGCANETEKSVLDYIIYQETPFFADLSILRPRVKGRSFRRGGVVVISSLPSPLLPPPAGWVRCKAHHQVAPGETATLTQNFQLHEIARAPFAPSAQNSKSGSCAV